MVFPVCEKVTRPMRAGPLMPPVLFSMYMMRLFTRIIVGKRAGKDTLDHDRKRGPGTAEGNNVDRADNEATPGRSRDGRGWKLQRSKRGYFAGGCTALSSSR